MVRLTDAELLVLTAIQLNADEDLVAIARRTKVSVHKVRYCVHKFEESGLIRRRVTIDNSLLGLTQFTFYLAVGFSDKPAAKTWLDRVCSHPNVLEVYDLAGAYNIGINISAAEPQTALAIIDELTCSSSLRLNQRAFGIRLGFTLFRRRIWTDRGLAPHCVTVSRSSERLKIDPLSKTILQEYCKPAPSNRERAKRLSLPQSTFESRIRELRKSKLILGEVYGIYTEKMGLLTYRILVRLNRPLESREVTIQRCVKACPNIYFASTYLAEWDLEFIAEVNAPGDIAEVTQTIRQVLGENLDALNILHLVKYRKVLDHPVLDVN